MSEPRVLLEWQFTPDYDDATPESYRLREGRCEQPPLVEWRNPAGDWVSGVTIGWTDEAILVALVRQVRGLAASRERIAALGDAFSQVETVLIQVAADCPWCAGTGSYAEAAHDPACDGTCRNCPVPVGVQCRDCASVLAALDKVSAALAEARS